MRRRWLAGCVPICVPALGLCVLLGVWSAAGHAGMTCEAALVRDGVAVGRQFMVSAAHPAAAVAGCRVLASGGSAADAAVAVQLVLAVVEPQSSGPGGGTLAIHYRAATRTLQVYDGVAGAPRRSGQDLRAAMDDAEARRCGTRRFPRRVTITARAIAVPGTLPALAQIHLEHGRLSWRALFDDAIRVARGGFALPAYMHALLAEPVNGIGRCRWPHVAARYCDDAAMPRPVGTWIRNEPAARTLEQLRDGGSSLFNAALSGALDEWGVEACDPDGAPPVVPSTMTATDLESYKVAVREPLCARVFGYRVCSAPPPSYGGFVVLRILDFMQRAYPAAPGSVEDVHRLLQASHLAQLARRETVGDPAFTRIDVRQGLSAQALQAAFSSFSPHRPIVYRGPVADAAVQDETTHVSIVDPDGNAIAMTATINKSFGAHVEVGGFFLNNGLSNFTSPRAQAAGYAVNAMAPGKRPRTAMAPVMVFDGEDRLRLVSGSAGGAAIPDYVAQSLLGVLVHGMDARAALAQGRISGQRLDTTGGVSLRAELESGTAVAAHRKTLEAMGYPSVRVGPLRSGLTMVRLRDDGFLEGAADPRRDGAAVGR